MRAAFDQRGESRPVLVLEPETITERILLACFLRYDANALSAEVERLGGELISSVTLLADQSA